MDILKYNDYEGTAELDMTRGVCRGKVLFISDVVTYESALPVSLQKEFEAAVDDYIETCAALGRNPQKPLKGQFNVRVPPALHKAATLRALADDVSLNDVVVKALDAYVNAVVAVNHVENKTYYVLDGEVVGALAHAGEQQVTYPLRATISAIGGAPVVVPASVFGGDRYVEAAH